jgi:tetratricopeptide (TPR) repeat protein
MQSLPALLFLVFAWMLSPGCPAAETRLLPGAGARLLTAALNGREVRQAQRLTDGDRDLPATGLQHGLTLVFELPETASPGELVIHLPATLDDRLLGELELLGSLVSAATGYRLLRSVPVSGGQRRQAHRLPPVAARWLMLRFTPAAAPPDLAISELEVFGRAGPPESVYAFRESPAGALQVLEGLQGTVAVTLSGAETALFRDAADGRLDDGSLADAALLASGVGDAEARQTLLRRIDALERDFRASLAGDRPEPFELGRRLLVWLHGNALQGGYEEGQTDLSTLLRDGRFNCVSSAVLYNLLGRRLGLDVRGIEVPDHALAILYHGSRHADVETTNPDGFNPARSRAAVEAFQATTGFAYIPDRHPEQRRELSTLQLIALIHYNHGVELSRQGRYLDALLASFRALSLDREAASAVKNALATLANWSAALAREGAYGEALRITGAGLALAPQDARLTHNLRAIWQNRLLAAADGDDPAAFLELVRQAGAALPEAGFAAQQSLYAIRQGERLAARGQWPEALARTAVALPEDNPAARAEREHYRRNLVLRWSGEAIGQRRWAAALDALEQGLALFPEDRRIAGNIAYVLQEWSEEVFRASGEPASEALVRQVAARFPQLDSVRRAGRGYAIRRIQELTAAARYAEALALVDEYRHLIGSDRDFATLVRSIYDARAKTYLDDQDWDMALAVYAQARAAFPDNPQLRRNQVATWHAWARRHMDAGRWSEALEVYQAGLAQLPGERSFQDNRG